MKKFIGSLFNIIILITGGYLIYQLFLLTSIETTLRYMIMGLIFFIALLIISLTMIYALKKKKSGFIVILLISLAISMVFAFGDYSLYKVTNTLSMITKAEEDLDISLVSLEEINPDELKNQNIGIISETYASKINELSKDLIVELKYDNQYQEYEDFYEIGKLLLSKELKYAIVPSNYSEILGTYDELEELVTNLKVLKNKKQVQEIKQEEVPEVVKSIDEPFSLLIIGVDSLKSSYNADTLLVVTFNPKTLTATMLSIPRDTYTRLGYGGKHKINASGWSGDNSVVKTVESYLDIDIDYYVKINFKGVVKLIDALGGIDVKVPYSFCEQNSSRQWGKHTVFVYKGNQHLDGEQALALSRNRHSPSDYETTAMSKYCPKLNEGVRNDFVRGQNQQLVLKAALNKVKTIKSVETLYEILDVLGKNMNTNMSKKTILSFYELAKNIISQTENLELTDVISIQKLYLESFILTVRISNMNLSCVGHYKGSLDAVKDAMNDNLKAKSKKEIKELSFNINNKYDEKSIGKGVYGAKNMPNLMGNYVKKNISTLENWANANGYTLKITTKDVTKTYQTGQIIKHEPAEYTDLDTVGKTIKVTVANRIEVPVEEPINDPPIEENNN